MTDDKWNNFETTVKTWQKANKGWNDEGHDNYSEDLDSLTTLMKKGKKNKDRRSRIMSTVRTLFMDISTSPFKTGKASTMGRQRVRKPPDIEVPCWHAP